MENLEMKTIVIFDVEGPLVNPKFDLAWVLLDKLLAEEKITQDTYDLVKRFDDYDDARWLKEREKKVWSTGTTPAISRLIATWCGMKDREILDFVKEGIVVNKGVPELMSFLEDNNIETYLVSSSAPQQAITTREQFKHIPPSQVFCAGKQLKSNEKEYLDSLHKENKPLVSAELGMRSPTEILEDQRELGGFIQNYLLNCKKWVDDYDSGGENLEAIQKEQDLLFENIKDSDLKKSLEYIIKYQKGMRGGHRKAEIVEQIKEQNPDAKIVYVGDSIVDADVKADIVIATNCKDKYAIQSCDISIATTDFKYVKEIFEDIHEGRVRDIPTYVEQRQSVWYNNEEVHIFSQEDIENNLGEVLGTNTEFKKKLKDSYSHLLIEKQETNAK